MTNENTAPTLRSLDMPRLIVELPDGKEIQHHLSSGEITIGRDPKNRIAIADDFISKFHAKLIISKTSLVLVDLESANKTYVNDRPISEAPVRYGDKIRFAAVKCRLEAPESHAKKAAPVVAHKPPVPPVAAPPPKPAPPQQASPRSAAKPSPAKTPGSAPPPIEADPMKRLLRVGGLLILVSLALGIMLRVLLVPSDAPPESDAQARGGTEIATGTGTTNTDTDTDTDTDTEAPRVETTETTPAVTTTAAPVTTSEQDPEYYFDEGLAHLDTGRLREARESFERALELDADHSRARTRLSLLEEEIEKKLERHFDNARQAFQFLRYEEAIAEWEMFLLLADENDTRYREAGQGIQQAQAKLR